VIDAGSNVRWVDEMRTEMRDVFKELGLEAEPYVVEKDQMLMNLAHIAHVWHDWQVEELC
jgi:hypothetical protein